jgi:hypothetical protein
MSELIYAVFGQSKRLAAVLAEIVSDVSAGFLDDTLAIKSDARRAAIARCGRTCSIEIREDVGGSEAAAYFFGDVEDMESVGLSWDVLLMFHMRCHCAVWLRTYSREALCGIGPVTDRILQGARGVVLTSDQFESFTS